MLPVVAVTMLARATGCGDVLPISTGRDDFSKLFAVVTSLPVRPLAVHLDVVAPTCPALIKSGATHSRVCAEFQLKKQPLNGLGC